MTVATAVQTAMNYNQQRNTTYLLLDQCYLCCMRGNNHKLILPKQGVKQIRMWSGGYRWKCF